MGGDGGKESEAKEWCKKGGKRKRMVKVANQIWIITDEKLTHIKCQKWSRRNEWQKEKVIYINLEPKIL